MELPRYETGKCLQMCPLSEINMRERHKLLHPLEMVSGTTKADVNRTVKAFSRSAADVCVSSPNNLRPFEVLKMTVKYLLMQAINDNRVSTLSRFNFVEDRLRSVRQDMTIQVFPPDQCAILLEPMVYFYTIFGYRLCELKIQEFDPLLNRKHLMECLKWLLVCYDEIENNKNTRRISLLKALGNLKVNDDNINESTNDRELMESLYILHNLGDTIPLMRYLHTSRKFDRNNAITTAYEISISLWNGNYVRVCRQASSLPSLCLCAFALQLPLIQKKALLIMSHAYKSKMLSYPPDNLCKILFIESRDELKTICNYYGIQMNSSGVTFNTDTTILQLKPMQPRKKRLIDELNCQIINCMERIFKRKDYMYSY